MSEIHAWVGSITAVLMTGAAYLTWWKKKARSARMKLVDPTRISIRYESVFDVAATSARGYKPSGWQGRPPLRQTWGESFQWHSVHFGGPDFIISVDGNRVGLITVMEDGTKEQYIIRCRRKDGSTARTVERSGSPSDIYLGDIPQLAIECVQDGTMQ